MKKLFTLLLILCLLTLLFSCSEQEANDSGTSATESSPEKTSITESEEETVYLDGKKLVVFGDSITALGSWGRSSANELNMYFFNGAMGGITSTQGIDRFDAYVASQSPDFVTVLFGMNDLIMTAANTPRVTPEQFGENLKTLVEMIRDCGAVPILMTSNPLNPDLFYSVQGQNSAWYSLVGTPLEWLDVYNEMTRTVAAQTDAFLIDTREACEGVSFTVLLSDGIHLAAKGNEIFTNAVAEFFKSHYENDPDAAPVSESDTYVYVQSGDEAVSLVSFSAESWYTVTASYMRFTEKDGAISVCNTNGLWPEAHCLPEAPLCVSVSDGVLYYDITLANVNASLILFFDGATPSAYTDGQYIVINPSLGGNTDSYTGDLLASQTLKGSVALSSIGIPASCVSEGNVLITGVKLFVAGNAYQYVTIKELSVGVE